jgi:hypothetical protein
MGIKQHKKWISLRDRLKPVLEQFGSEDSWDSELKTVLNDYYFMEDNWGGNYHKVEIHNLRMLKPEVIKSIQGLLHDHPKWHVFIQVDVPGTEEAWPNMSLFVYADKVVDGLERDYLPEEFQGLVYEGSVPLFEDLRERDEWVAAKKAFLEEISSVRPNDKKLERQVIEKHARRAVKLMAKYEKK